jgi:hypothetical protein
MFLKVHEVKALSSVCGRCRTFRKGLGKRKLGNWGHDLERNPSPFLFLFASWPPGGEWPPLHTLIDRPKATSPSDNCLFSRLKPLLLKNWFSQVFCQSNRKLTNTEDIKEDFTQREISFIFESGSYYVAQDVLEPAHDPSASASQMLGLLEYATMPRRGRFLIWPWRMKSGRWFSK